jgi:peptidoglycan/xylan/chitin deacetylase (PgdA/CDA1 family)
MPSSADRPVGFVHVDLDGLWTLAGAYGYPEEDSFTRDVVFERGVDRLLELLAAHGARATFFLLGRDLELPAKAATVKRIAAAGHELANHSYSHFLDLDRRPEAEIRREIERTSAAIEAVAGARPLGFRAPGYAAGPRTLAVCLQAGLRYDGSNLPTWWAPVLRGLAGRLRRKVRRELGEAARPVANAGQYGGAPAIAGDPLAPQWWHAPSGDTPVLRLPLAVSPMLRLPLHASLGMLLGAGRVRAGLRRLARRGHPVTWLLHGMDAVGAEDLAGRLPSALANAWAFRRTLAAKFEFLHAVLTEFQRVTRVELTAEWLRTVRPDSSRK